MTKLFFNDKKQIYIYRAKNSSRFPSIPFLFVHSVYKTILIHNGTDIY